MKTRKDSEKQSHAFTEVNKTFGDYCKIVRKIHDLKEERKGLAAEKEKIGKLKKGDQSKTEKELKKLGTNITKLQISKINSYNHYLEMREWYWPENNRPQLEPDDPLIDCADQSSPLIFWKVGKGSFHNSYFGDLAIVSTPPPFQVNQISFPWTDVYYSVDGPILDPAVVGVMGGMGSVSGGLLYGIDISRDRCGFELIAGFDIEGLIQIPNPAPDDFGVRINMSIEMAQYRGHGRPISEHNVKELHPGIGPEMFRYWRFSCLPGMYYETNKPGDYTMPKMEKTVIVRCKDIKAGDSLVVEYQFSIQVSHGCGISLYNNNIGLLDMELPILNTFGYPVSRSDFATNWVDVSNRP